MNPPPHHNRNGVRRRWLGLTLFIAVFVAGDRIVGTVFERLLMNSGLRYSRLYRGNAEADVIILGNSRAVNSFYAPEIARRFQCKCVSLAYNGMSPDVSLAFLQDYLDRHAAPKLLLLEATLLDTDSTCIVNYKPYWRRSHRLTEIARRVVPQSELAARCSRLFEFNCELFLRALSYLRENDQSWINRDTIGPELVELTRSMPTRVVSPASDTDLQWLRSLIDVADRHGIKCHVIVAPYLPDYYSKLSGLDEWMAAVESTLGDRQLIDLSLLLSDTSDFADRLHTNLRGSTKILDELEKRDVFDTL